MQNTQKVSKSLDQDKILDHLFHIEDRIIDVLRNLRDKKFPKNYTLGFTLFRFKTRN